MDNVGKAIGDVPAHDRTNLSKRDSLDRQSKGPSYDAAIADCWALSRGKNAKIVLFTRNGTK